MQFDLFHSIGRIDSVKPVPCTGTTFRNFLEQCREGEAMGYSTIWVAESHFSSEVQKCHAEAVIPHYAGEVGLNCDSPQLAHEVFAVTKKMAFGTAIFNIVGGNGGPIAAADRIRTLSFLNSCRSVPRDIYIGFASGRFPYINKPFGIVPRCSVEMKLWPQYQRLMLLEAGEIFLRLLRGETLSSEDVQLPPLDERFFRSPEEFAKVCRELPNGTADVHYKKRWCFEKLKLVPLIDDVRMDLLHFVLGSADPLARNHLLQFADLDIFNLSFTPPAQIEKIHAEMTTLYQGLGRSWQRRRLPRTVLVFIDQNSQKARDRASRCFDTYIEAMRGTAAVPAKEVLMERALTGSPAEIRDQLSPTDPHGFHFDDRLMLWFEFNQVDGPDILAQMRLFAAEVAPHYV